MKSEKIEKREFRKRKVAGPANPATWKRHAPRRQLPSADEDQLDLDLMTSTPDQTLALFTLPILSPPSLPPSQPYDPHRSAHTPLVIDNGSTSLRFGFATSTRPQVAPNIVSKYKERKAGKQLLLFGDAVDTEGGARSQAKTPWEGDVLLNFDALVSPARIRRSSKSSYLSMVSRNMRWTTPLFGLVSTHQLSTIL